jgi:hypothetical protein
MKKEFKFKYLELYAGIPVFLAVAGLCLIYLFDMMRAQDKNYILVFLLSLIFFLMIKGVHRTLALYADIVIDDQGVRKELFGITIKNVSWNGIRLIKVHDRRHANYMVNYIATRKERPYCIDIYPTKSSFDLIYFGRKVTMWSAGNPLAGNSFYKVIDIINKYIKEYDVKVEDDLNGSTSDANQLPMMPR